jgi:hypothetical protein
VPVKLRAAAFFFLGSALSPAARLSPAASEAFDRYTAAVEVRLARQHAQPETYLAALPREPGLRVQVERQLRAGAVRIEPVHGGSWEINGGLLHHWRGVAFVPNASPEEMLQLLRDYDHLSQYYAPEVVSSHALSQRGTGAILAMRFKKQRVVSVVLDAEFATESRPAGGRGYSASRSIHIWQVAEPGTAREHRRSEGADDGFLWRLNSYWSFEKQPGGLLIECEAVSLTRSIPAGLGWLIGPIIETLPRESLEFTLNATRNSLITGAKEEVPNDRTN